MYDKITKRFLCDQCQKEITAGEKCWTKWSFPAKVTTSQYMPIKVLEFENAPIICADCETTVIHLNK